DGGDDRDRVAVVRHVPHEGHVDLEAVDRQLLHVAQRGVAFPEVVDRDRHAHALQLLEQVGREADVVGADVLRQLQRQLARVELVRPDRVGDEPYEIAMAELDGGQVHGDRQPRLGPLPVVDLPARRAQHPLADLEDQPGLLELGDEARGRYGSELAVVPAEERLGARDAPIGEVAVRLVVDAVLAVPEAVGHAALDRVVMERALAQLATEEADRVAAEGLGERERDVGVLQDRPGVGQVLGRHGDTDAHGDGDVVAGDVRLAREHAEDALSETARLGGAAAVEDAELVAAQAAYAAARADDVAQYAREVPQHLV